MPQRGSLFVENISVSAIFAPAGQLPLSVFFTDKRDELR
jgi:hypothetical protein